MRKPLAALVLLALSSTVHANAGIVGTVTSKATDQPLQGATVEAYSVCPFPFPICSDYQSTITGADGAYSVEATAGEVSLAVHYLPGQANYAPITQTLMVVDGQALQNDVQLDFGATIEGTVTGASDGAVQPSIPLTLLSGDLSSIVTTTGTDTNGAFRIEQLPAGSYGLRTDHAVPFQDQFYAARKLTPPSQGSQVFDPIDLIAGQTVNADFSLVVAGTIDGVITDRYTGLPIAHAPNVEFQIYDANDTSGQVWIYDYLVTDASGHYVLQGLPDAPIEIGVYSENPYYAPTIIGCSDPCSDVTAGTTYTAAADTSQTADFSMFPGHVITGTVTRRSDGLPLQGVKVSAYLNSSFLGQLLFAQSATDAAGHYVLAGGLTDQVYVSATDATSGNVVYIDQVYADHDCIQGNCVNVGDLVDAPGYQATDGIDFHLDVGATISGRVVLGDSGAGDQAVLSLFAADDSLSMTFLADAEGNFGTTGLQPGTYYLTAAAGSVNYNCVTYPDLPCTGEYQGLNPDAAPIIIIGTNDVTGILLVLPTETIFTSGFE